MNSVVPYSTGCPLSTCLAMMVPETSHSISFISFMLSTMQSTLPGLTASPTLTNSAAPGEAFGMLALGSEDAARFYADMGTLYLMRLGEMAGAGLTRFI